MSIQSAQQLGFGFCGNRTIEFEQVSDNMSSDAGLIAFGDLDQKLGWTSSFSRQITDPRQEPSQSLLSVIRQRVFGILAGYEDQNDHDALRSDPIFKLLADRHPDDDHDLASQPTISRIENFVTAGDLLRLEDWFIDRFVDSFTEPPGQITLDIDTFDDPTHGDQQLTFFNNFYKQHQYQVRVITCAENDFVVLPVLLFGNAHVALAADDDLARVIERLRERFPDVQIHVRADAGFAVPRMYEMLERYHEVTYSIGYQMNSLMRSQCDRLMQETLEFFEQTGQPQQRFMFINHQARTWTRPRFFVIKCEANLEGTNRRIVVTNRLGAEQYPGCVYREYAERGESENRNKELKCELGADRLSDHRYMANLFRTMMHALSANLLVMMRRHVAAPPPVLATADALPSDAMSASQKKRQQNHRRRTDPLGEGHACTWRTHVIKVAARVVVTTRRVRILISKSWPYANYLRQVSNALLTFSPSPPG